jgi:hypothetical protein
MSLRLGAKNFILRISNSKKECVDFGVPFDTGKIAEDDSVYGKPFFSLLGAQTTESIDNSDYENAIIIHDMNNPLPAELKGKFSVMADAGTLEHVFNYPTAIKYYMQLLKLGGVYIHNPC